jgi:hypothetical protein
MAFEPSLAKDEKQFTAQRPPADGVEILPGEPTVTMVFPKPVLLTLPGYRRVQFKAGVNQVPQSLADHEYLKLSGATRHQGPVPGTQVGEAEKAKADADAKDEDLVAQAAGKGRNGK